MSNKEFFIVFGSGILTGWFVIATIYIFTILGSM